MKIIKKLATLILAVCLVFPVFPMVAEAANGQISFTDPSTKAGDVVEVACALRSSEGSVGGFHITLNYDPAFLAFQGGAGITQDAPGVITYYGTGDGSNLLRFMMQFQALQPGTTAITVSAVSATISTGEAINTTAGGATVTIAEGVTVQPPEEAVPEEPEVKPVEVKVGKETYTLAAQFEEDALPEGFEEGTMKYKDAEFKIAQQKEGKLKLAYLLDKDQKGRFFIYDEKENKFSPYVKAVVSPSTSVVLLEKAKKVNLPEQYEKGKLTVDGFDFQAWEDTAHKGIYLVYAMDQDGDKAFYQYDKADGSYQRFAYTEVFEAKEEVKESNGMNPFLILGGILLIGLVVAVIILSVRLRNMNREIDDLYDEYGIEEDVIRLDPKEETGYLDDDDDDDDNEQKNEKKDDKVAKGKVDVEDPLDDDLDFDDDDFDVDFIDLDE